MNYFQKQGRSLLANGYLIVPIKPGHKRPALSNWQTARLGAADLSAYPKHGAGVLCGQGAHPIAAIDIDTSDEALASRFSAWCHDNLGVTVERVGNAPKVLLVYRAAEAGWCKCTGAWFEDELGLPHRLEVLGHGQQFVAYHVHPDTNRPYEWVDFMGGLEAVRADDLPVVTSQQITKALRVFEEMAEAAGLVRRSATAGAAPAQPKERTPREEEDFFGRVNEAAMADFGMWVPRLFPSAQDYQGGYRVTSVDLGRDLEEDLSISPEGIVDFGVADMGDERKGKRTPIDLVLEWAPQLFDDPFDAPLNPFDAALWLCDCMDTPKEDLGFGLRRQKEKAAERSAKRIALEALAEQITSCEDSIQLMDEVAKEARELLRETPALQVEVAALLKRRFQELTGVIMPVGELNKALKHRSTPTVRTKRPFTEFGNAERMLDLYGQGLMFVPEMPAWFCWTGVFWRQASNVEIAHMAKETVKALGSEVDQYTDGEALTEFYQFCAASQKDYMVKNMVSLASSDPRVMVPAAELDKHLHMVGALNGVIDLRTGELLPSDPELRITKVVGCEYDPRAKAPLFEQTLADVFQDDTEMVNFFQRLVGYTMTGNPKEDVLVIPHGNGSNGKSTILGNLRRAFGDYARVADADTFLSTGNSGGGAGKPREDLLRLKGARLVYVSEPEENSELREGAVKAMTGGDAITARGIQGKASVEFNPSWVIYMPTNHKPIIKGSDTGIWRRLMLVPFNRNFEADPNIKKDPLRREKIAEELPGILAWIIRGVATYRKHGLATVGTVQKARNEYKEQMDLLAEWLEECCEVGDNLFAESKELWASWCEFAKQRGLLQYVKNSVSLGRRLEARFPAGKLSGGVRIRKGLRVRDDFTALV
jgi:putative DNA primase/helicase